MQISDNKNLKYSRNWYNCNFRILNMSRLLIYEKCSHNLNIKELLTCYYECDNILTQCIGIHGCRAAKSSEPLTE